MRKRRKNYTAQEKVFILKRHLVDRVPASDLCDEYNLQPTVFYRWQKGPVESGLQTCKLVGNLSFKKSLIVDGRTISR